MEMKNPLEIPALFPVRKSRKQKKAFQEAVLHYAEQLGYPVTLEKGSFGAVNILLGNPNTAGYLITAHYDTCARLPIPNLVTPCSLLLFLLYQLLLSFLIMFAAIPGAIAVGWLFRSAVLGGFTWMVLVTVFLVMVMIGPANPSNVNDNTSGVIAALEIAASLPQNLRDNVCIVLFDLEEAGLIGSSSYFQKHRKTAKTQLVLNMDCVGEGDEIYFFPTGKLKRNAARMKQLQTIAGKYGKKKIALHSKGFAMYPSDQVLFPYGVGICALNRNKLGLYLSRIHTPRDTILDETNVNILRAALITLIGSERLNKKGKGNENV